MSRPSKPNNEALRLNELARYDLLDSAAEPAFDESTASIAKICGTPNVLLTLVDQNRQWFKSRVGLEATETPRDVSFCGHALLNPEQVMIVPDALKDERFVDNPLVTRTPNIRFYAGTPLVTENGYALGTLCVIDIVPRTLTSEQLETLEMAARMAIKLFEQRLSAKRLETATAAASASLRPRYARKLPGGAKSKNSSAWQPRATASRSSRTVLNSYPAFTPRSTGCAPVPAVTLACVLSTSTTSSRSTTR
jgi:hypothetical protein